MFRTAFPFGLSLAYSGWGCRRRRLQRKKWQQSIGAGDEIGSLVLMYPTIALALFLKECKRKSWERGRWQKMNGGAAEACEQSDIFADRNAMKRMGGDADSRWIWDAAVAIVSTRSYIILSMVLSGREGRREGQDSEDSVHQLPRLRKLCHQTSWGLSYLPRSSLSRSFVSGLSCIGQILSSCILGILQGLQVVYYACTVCSSSWAALDI